MQIKVQNFIKKRMFYLFFDQKYKKKRHFLRKVPLSAQDETRTHTILRPLPPQSRVYTNFTTCASREARLNMIRNYVAHVNFRRLLALPTN